MRYFGSLVRVRPLGKPIVAQPSRAEKQIAMRILTIALKI